MNVSGNAPGEPINSNLGSGPAKRATRLRVVQFPVHNTSYPRNRRIREYFDANGWECTPIARGKGRETTLIEKASAVASLWRNMRSADVVILSEMSLKYAPLTWFLSRVHGAVHIVDGFIGLYETDVEDKKLVHESSIRAKILHLQDGLAVRLADIYLVDTELRADNVKKKFSGDPRVHSLPVGAPKWAQHCEYYQTSSLPEVLYYGNYIPLHGLRDYVLAIYGLDPSKRPTTRMIGNGDCYDDVRDLIEKHELGDFFVFQGPVAEADLAAAIGEAKVVLGIFGTSKKAASVIANKVWQGLASSRRVITRESDALSEVTDVCGDLLVQVPVGDPKLLGQAIAKAVQDDLPASAAGLSAQLEDYVTSKFDEFLRILSTELGRKRRNPRIARRSFR